MLIYTQAYDIYHSIFRVLQIMENIENSIEVDKLRILDFYLLFPAELSKIDRFKGFRKYLKTIPNKNQYEVVKDKRRLFFKMEHIQDAAIRTLVAYNLLDATEFKNGRVKRTEVKIREELYKKIVEANERESNVISLITGPLADMNLYGSKGLKDRTSLIEFRYDTA